MANFRIGGIPGGFDVSPAGEISPRTVLDQNGCSGTVGQALTSDGTGALTWATVGGGVSPATPTAEGTVCGCTSATNTFLGSSVGSTVTTGVNNTILGVGSGAGITSGSNNVFIGCSAGAANTTGSGAVAIGNRALQASVNAGNQIAIGDFSLNSNTCNSPGNIAIGPQALRYWNQTGASNTGSVAIGQLALRCSNSAFVSNIAIGTNAMAFDVTGSQNVVIGNEAAYTSTGSVSNTVIGFYAMCQGTGVTGNVVVGRMAMQTGTGCYNVVLGYNAATSVTGSNNIAIGCCATTSAISVSNEVNLYNGSVTARFQGAASGWSFVSDERDKSNVTALPVGLDFVNNLEPRQFEWSIRGSEVDTGKAASGFIAQEVDSVVESFDAGYLNLVDKNDPERYTLTQTNLIPVLVKAIQELSTKNDALEARIAQLEANG